LLDLPSALVLDGLLPCLIDEIVILIEYFEYVFVIGNHLLQKHIAFAPNLAAQGKANSYARLCIDTILELLLWLRSRAERLESVLPCGGLCLIGRGEFDNEDGSVGAARRAVGSSLNEKLLLVRARHLLMVRTGRDSKGVKSKSTWVDQSFGISSHRVDVINLENVSNWRRGATFLAAGIVPTEPTHEQFGVFCRDLIVSLGWSIMRRDVAGGVELAMALNGKKMVRVATYTNGTDAAELVTAMRKFTYNSEPLCILTNVSLPRHLRSELSNLGGHVIHYSIFEKWVYGPDTR
jgi:hypothetical protein